MKGMATYDMMEAIRNSNEWMGASARAFASYPVWGLVPHPMFKVMSAWGRVTERSFRPHGHQAGLEHQFRCDRRWPR